MASRYLNELGQHLEPRLAFRRQTITLSNPDAEADDRALEEALVEH